MKYQITSYQIIHSNGERDTIKPLQPIITWSVEKEREKLKRKYGVPAVNISYTTIPDDYEEDEEE